jgi:hypothetical protein
MRGSFAVYLLTRFQASSSNGLLFYRHKTENFYTADMLLLDTLKKTLPKEDMHIFPRCGSNSSKMAAMP